MYDKELRYNIMANYYSKEYPVRQLAKIYNIDCKCINNWKNKGIISKFELRKNYESNTKFIPNLNKHCKKYDKPVEKCIIDNINNCITTYESEIKEQKKLFLGKKKYRNPLITPEIEKFIIDFVKQKPKTKYSKILNEINIKFKIKLNKSNIYFVLHNNDLTYKTVLNIFKPIHKKEEHQQRKNEIIEELKLTDFITNKDKQTTNNTGLIRHEFDKSKIENIINIDEVGYHVGATNNKGWFPKKTNNAVQLTKNIKFQKTTTVIAISPNGIVGHETKKKSFNGESFLNFFKELNKKTKKSTFFMDNCTIHKCALIKSYIKDEHSDFNKNGNKIIYNVPYSPEYCPVELVNNILKKELKYNDNTTEEMVATNITEILKNMKEASFMKHYNHAFSYFFN